MEANMVAWGYITGYIADNGHIEKLLQNIGGI